MHNFVILNASCFFIILSFLVNYNEKNIFFSFLLELKIKNNIYITTIIITTKANRKKNEIKCIIEIYTRKYTHINHIYSIYTSFFYS
jgi:hypothetical protein